jgi:hypothetical protein
MAAGVKPIYVRCGKVIDDVRAVAREHGYALGVHGSLRAERDIDLIAVPWTKDAHAASTLRRAVAALPYLHFNPRQGDGGKPHGRKAWAFVITHRARGCPAYVDLSVMPRA